MYQPITKNGVDAAQPLEFPTKPKADLTITIKARVDGFDTEICYTGSVDQLLQVTQRLRALGAEPVSAAQTAPAVTNGAASPARKAAAKRVEPAYDDDGQPICPTHRKPLKAGSWGLYCPAKDASTERGYCSLKFVE